MNQSSNPNYEDNMGGTLNNNILKYKISESSGVSKLQFQMVIIILLIY